MKKHMQKQHKDKITLANGFVCNLGGEMPKKDCSLAILTPTYNRCELLKKAYDSLKKQSNKNFVWYVVDDGSTDNTKQVVETFENENSVKVKYFHKENGGKHTALNVGLQKVAEDFVLILDSDDALTYDAVQTALADAATLDEGFCGLGYLKSDAGGNVVGKNYTGDGVEDTFVNQRYNKNTFGDKAEVFRTEILKQFPFPQFDGEKFVSEAVVWCKMSGPYKMKFFNKAIYECEYQADGLTNNIKKILLRNPKGASACYKVLSGKQFNLKNKIKYTLLFDVYMLADQKKFKQIMRETNNRFLAFWLYIPAVIIFKKWKRSFAN